MSVFFFFFFISKKIKFSLLFFLSFFLSTNSSNVLEIYFANQSSRLFSAVRDRSRPDNKVVTTRLTRRGRSDENEAGFSEKDLGNTLVLHRCTVIYDAAHDFNKFLATLLFHTFVCVRMYACMCVCVCVISSFW